LNAVIKNEEIKELDAVIRMIKKKHWDLKEWSEKG
jgi:hypothetical protein